MANRTSAIRFLTRQPGIELHCKDDGGFTPLHHAANVGNLRAVEALMDSGVDVQLCTNGSFSSGHGPQACDFSPLDFAAFRGHLDVAKALVRRGADVRGRASFSSLAPLHHAAAGNKVDVVEFLVRAGAAVDGPTPLWRPLHFAVQENHAEAILALGRHGADLHLSHVAGPTPHAQAALRTNVEAVKALLDAGADPNVNDGNDPVLHTAARLSNPRNDEIVRVLLEHGADANAIRKGQEQPLHGAVLQGTVDTVDLLVEYGADVDGHGDHPSPLQVACSSTHCSTFCDRVSALLGHGADAHLQDGRLNSALHMAAVNRSAEMVDLLLRAGANETVANEEGHTPAELVRRTRTNGASDEIFKPTLKLLDDALAARTWRRRSFLVLCRAFPGKARLESTLRTRAELPRAAKRAAAARRGGDLRDHGGGVLTLTTQNGGFKNLLARLFRVEKEGVFRKIVCFL